MAKISFALLVIALLAFLHVSQAHRPSSNFDEQVLVNDLDEAKNLIEEDLKKKESSIKHLTDEVQALTKSETMLNELGDAYANGKSLAPFGTRLKRFNRRIKQAPEEVRYVSIIQCILKDLGLNAGKN